MKQKGKKCLTCGKAVKREDETDSKLQFNSLNKSIEVQELVLPSIMEHDSCQCDNFEEDAAAHLTKKRLVSR